jgi:hypothetical protein
MRSIGPGGGQSTGVGPVVANVPRARGAGTRTSLFESDAVLIGAEWSSPVLELPEEASESGRFVFMVAPFGKHR